MRVLFLKSMPLVNVQKHVDFTDFTAHSRNFQIIYIFKSCKYSLHFVVQVCLDHAEHICIWKVKITESKHSASETISWSLFVMHVQGHCCIRQLRLKLTNVHTLHWGTETCSVMVLTHIQQYSDAWYMTISSDAGSDIDTDSTGCVNQGCSVHIHSTTLCTQHSAGCMGCGRI